MSHKQRVLELLRDGEPHGHMEGYRLGVMLHSRVADLRRDGHDIECWRDGDNYLYRLLNVAAGDEPNSVQGSSPLLAATLSSPAPNPRDDGEQEAPLRDGAGQLSLHIPRSAYERAA